jgi:hypothetical protein
MKAVRCGEISLLEIFPSLRVRTLEKILKLQLHRLIGLYFFIDLAPISLEIRVRRAKFNLFRSRFSL